MKFRRKQSEIELDLDDVIAAAGDIGDADEVVIELVDDDAAEEELIEADSGPFDADELPDEQRAVERADLGSLLVAPPSGKELRLQVDERTGAVASVLVAGEDGALEVKAFAAPRNGDLWSEVLPQLKADVAQRGGVTAEREGAWGTELLCQLQVQLPDGQTGVQPSRIVGVNGPRWLLRATFLGQPAVDPDNAGEWEQILAGIVVRRGKTAMPKGEALPLTLPPEARQVEGS